MELQTASIQTPVSQHRAKHCSNARPSWPLLPYQVPHLLPNFTASQTLHSTELKKKGEGGQYSASIIAQLNPITPACRILHVRNFCHSQTSHSARIQATQKCDKCKQKHFIRHWATALFSKQPYRTAPQNYPQLLCWNQLSIISSLA